MKCEECLKACGDSKECRTDCDRKCTWDLQQDTCCASSQQRCGGNCCTPLEKCICTNSRSERCTQWMCVACEKCLEACGDSKECRENCERKCTCDLKQDRCCTPEQCCGDEPLRRFTFKRWEANGSCCTPLEMCLCVASGSGKCLQKMCVKCVECLEVCDESKGCRSSDCFWKCTCDTIDGKMVCKETK